MAELLTPPRDRLMPIERESLPAAMPAAIPSPGYSASLSADQQTITDVLSQVYRGTSVVRMAPLPPSAFATSNAAANSAAQVIVNNTPAPTPVAPVVSGVSSVTLTMPSQYAVSGSPGTGAVDLGVTWTAENPGTFLRAPAPGLSGLQSVKPAGGQSTPGATLSVTDTPTTSTSFGLFFGASNAGIATPSGWTAIQGGGTDYISAYQNISGTSPVSTTSTLSGTELSWLATMALFDGPAPSVVQSNTATSKSGTVHFTSNVTAGNTIVIVMQYQEFISDSNFSMLFSDAEHNSYSLIGSNNVDLQSGTSYPTVKQLVYVATNAVGGTTDTVTYNFGGKLVGASQTYNITIIELGPLASGSSFPIFGVISNSDLPPINLAASGNGGVGGILQPLDGGTGSDFSATGGTHEVVQQASSGANLTVGPIDFPFLAGAAGQFPTDYNGVALVSNGLPSEIAKADLTSQGAAITATTLISAPQTGMYRVSWSAAITTVDGVSSSLGGTNGFQVVYTSPTDSVAKTTAPQTPWATGLNTTGTADGGVMVVYAKTATNIQYAYDYTSATPGQMKYELHIKLEAL